MKKHLLIIVMAATATILFSRLDTKAQSSDFWQQQLQNARLTYEETVRSGDGSGSIRTKYIHDLCSNGRMNINIISFGTYGGAGSRDAKTYQGSWQIISEDAESSSLKINYDDGDTSTFKLSIRNNRIYFGNAQCSRTTENDGPENTPNCY